MDLSDKYIFILGMAKFDSEIESTTYTLAKHLARNNYVFYIENPYTWKDFILNWDKKDRARRKKYLLQGSRQTVDTDVPNLKVLIPPPLISINWIPESRIYRAILRLNERLMLNRI